MKLERVLSSPVSQAHNHESPAVTGRRNLPQANWAAQSGAVAKGCEARGARAGLGRGNKASVMQMSMFQRAARKAKLMSYHILQIG